MKYTHGGRRKRIEWICAMVTAGWFVFACVGAELFAEPPKSGAPGQANAQLPKFPKKFDVQGPESDSFGFAVTQPGAIVVDVQAQGAPVVVTLQSQGGQPIKQQGTGAIKLSYNVTPQDVQRSILWHVQVRAWCEDDCLKAAQRPRAAGSVMVQHPPVNQALVQQTVQTMTARQKQPSPQELQQGGARAAAQMEQAFQQRKVQFEQQQLQRRANLYARIQPQVDQLRGRVAGQVRPRGVEESAGPTGGSTGEDRLSSLPPPNVIWMTDDAPGEGQQDGEVGTRALPQVQRPMNPGMPAPSGGSIQPTNQQAAFPQKFQVQGPETDSFGFGVTQPGTVEVTVEAQGPPVIVTLQHLASPPITQQGSGQIRLSQPVNAEQIQKSALWLVKVKLAQAGTPASGTVMVQHPPADPAIVRAQTAALAQQEAAQQARTAAAVEAQSRAEFQAFKANLEQQMLQRQAAERAQNQALINRLRTQSGGMIRSRGLNPSITRINKNEGQPKAQVIIEGTNFGPGGEVIFQLGPNIAGTGVIEAWSDTVVVADVPDASGLLPYQGTIAIKVGQTLSNAVPFKFVPLQEVREIRSTQGDISVAQPGTVFAGSVVDRIEHPNNSFGQLSGSKGNDIFFPTRQLGNGWIVQDIRPKVDPCAYPNCRGAYVADSRIGTPLPFFNIRWWHEALVGARYWFSLWIVGPRGVPDGILVTGPLTPNVPPGTPPPPATASSTPPAERTPPAQPPYNPPSSSSGEPPQMTVVPINPALLIPQVQAAPGAGASPPGTTQSQPAAGQSGTKVAVDPKNTMNPTLHQAPPSGSSAPPQGGGSSAGTGGTMPPPASTPPVITSLSVTQGQPGDPVMINGSNFGSGVGEIHFVIANGKDVLAPAGAIWSDTQIFTSVPIQTGLTAYNGQIYVKRAADKKPSNLAAFRFEPTLELRRFMLPVGVGDKYLPRPPAYSGSGNYCGNGAGLCLVYNPPSFFEGAKGTDQFFINTHLTNGWVLDEVSFRSYQCENGCNYLDEQAIGSDRPYFTVRWWVNGGGFLVYSHSGYNIPWIAIRGPKGVPDGLTCTPASCTKLP